MQIEVTKEEDNTVLNRKELKVKVLHPAGTPSRIEVKNAVATQFKVAPELVIVDNMKTAFGKKETAAYIKIYESTEAAQQVEREHILKRNQPPASQSTEAKPTEEEAKPTEEEAKPTEEEAKPTEEEAKPTEEEAKPTDGGESGESE